MGTTYISAEGLLYIFDEKKGNVGLVKAYQRFSGIRCETKMRGSPIRQEYLLLALQRSFREEKPVTLVDCCANIHLNLILDRAFCEIPVNPLPVGTMHRQY